MNKKEVERTEKDKRKGNGNGDENSMVKGRRNHRKLKIREEK